ncbi:MAG: hypothetical protein BWY82_00772 [Verrucomicrobia bacterium ADurb.Bin474]|nr:MAG: hypothetical protein BWY82_00772 [Verrucomicrobia bacterium ADurb.Bin474]
MIVVHAISVLKPFFAEIEQDRTVFHVLGPITIREREKGGLRILRLIKLAFDAFVDVEHPVESLFVRVDFECPGLFKYRVVVGFGWNLEVALFGQPQGVVDGLRVIRK